MKLRQTVLSYLFSLWLVYIFKSGHEKADHTFIPKLYPFWD